MRQHSLWCGPIAPLRPGRIDDGHDLNAFVQRHDRALGLALCDGLHQRLCLIVIAIALIAGGDPARPGQNPRQQPRQALVQTLRKRSFEKRLKPTGLWALV